MKFYTILMALIALMPVGIGAMESESPTNENPVLDTVTELGMHAIMMGTLYSATRLTQHATVNFCRAFNTNANKDALYAFPMLTLGAIGFGYAAKYGILEPAKTAVKGLWDTFQPFKKSSLADRLSGLTKAGLATAMIGYSANLIHQALS